MLSINRKHIQEMLYDPGSTYCMITRATYESLRLKPPLSSVSNAGISVSGENFEFDGVVCLNLKFKGVCNTANFGHKDFPYKKL